MDKTFHMNMLYDFYGELLTEKQRDFFEQYYLNDLSLSEIAAQLGITPQGVSDLIKRTEKLLLNYDDKLNLSKRHRMNTQCIKDINSALDNLAGEADETAAYIRRKLADLL